MKLPLPAALLALAAALLLAACGGSGDGGGGEAAPPPTTTEEPETVSFEISAGPKGPEKVEDIEVEEGQRVEITVKLGWESHIHLHGYDLALTTGPGKPPARFRFTADKPGRYTLEAHQGWHTLARLTVRPS